MSSRAVAPPSSVDGLKNLLEPRIGCMHGVNNGEHNPPYSRSPSTAARFYQQVRPMYSRRLPLLYYPIMLKRHHCVTVACLCTIRLQWLRARCFRLLGSRTTSMSVPVVCLAQAAIALRGLVSQGLRISSRVSMNEKCHAESLFHAAS